MWLDDGLGQCPRCDDDTLYVEHVCPYDADINNDPDSMCTCCPEHTTDCADDI